MLAAQVVVLLLADALDEPIAAPAARRGFAVSRVRAVLELHAVQVAVISVQ